VFEALGVERMSLRTRNSMWPRERVVVGGEGIYIEFSQETSCWTVFLFLDMSGAAEQCSVGADIVLLMLSDVGVWFLWNLFEFTFSILSFTPLLIVQCF
jgi:hypothetical protein